MPHTSESDFSLEMHRLSQNTLSVLAFCNRFAVHIIADDRIAFIILPAAIGYRFNSRPRRYEYCEDCTTIHNI